MNVDTALLSLENPVFQTYVIATCIMILKLMLQPWMTVVRMMRVGSGFLSPEDLKKTPLNPNPEPTQLEVNEYVDRSRRLNLNDLESIPGFLAAGIFVRTRRTTAVTCSNPDLGLRGFPGGTFHRPYDCSDP